MLFQPTNIVPDMRSGIGLGVVDVTNGLQVSWQVNGDYPRMTAFTITIYLNDAASTQKYSTGDTPLRTGCPFFGRDSNGEINFFSYTIPPAALSSAGITNGNEYKLLIRQYYKETGDSGAELNVLQSSASVFVTRSTPIFNMTSSLSVASAEYTFTYRFLQTEGDTLDWIRYQISDNRSIRTILYDSGNIYSPGELSCTYSGFFTNQSYAIRATGQTSSGMSVSTEWESFRVIYSGTSLTGNITATCKDYNWYLVEDGVQVSWDNVSLPDGSDALSLYRARYNSDTNSTVLTKVADYVHAGRTSGNIIDYGVASGQGPYTYYLFARIPGDPTASPQTETTYTTAIVSNEVNPTFYYWALIPGTLQSDGTYLTNTTRIFLFQNNLDSGSISNNNSPNVLQNFTAFPTVQPSPSNYKSGTLVALVGEAYRGEYVNDTLSLRERILGLSTTQDTLFLKSPKGDIMTIAINGPITFSISDTTKGQPQNISVPWIEIDDSPVSIYV